MRRKNRKWVAMAAGAYLLVMVSAYRWAVSQLLPEGNIFNKIEHEGIKRLAEEKAKAAAEAAKPTGESRLTSAGPAFVAARYDATHVVFMLAAETESRFANSPLLVNANGTPTRVPAAAHPAASPGCRSCGSPIRTRCISFPRSFRRRSQESSGC